MMAVGDLPPYLYLTTLGWKTGRAHEIEIWYVPHAGRYYLISEMREQSHWVKNIQQQPTVHFRVGDQTYSGTARVVDAAAEPDLAAAVCQLMDVRYDWSEGLIIELASKI